jgi:DNA-binding NarL/FixJ family response regulator
MTHPPYALVVDDHPLVARGIAEYLVAHCGFDVAHFASNNAECWQRVECDGCPELVLVDFWLPDGAALGLLRNLAQRCSQARLLVMSGDDDRGIQAKAREAGAHGFIHKNESPDVFAKAVAELRQGDIWFLQPDKSVLPQPPRRELPINARDLGLTERQGQVLAMMLRGLPNKRIARALDVSEQTVKEHVTGILGKLGVSNRVEAITLLRGRKVET